MFRGNYQELARHPEILVPYLNNSSEETIFGSNKIKEEHETMKLQNEFHLKPWLSANELEQTSSKCISEKFLRKKLFVL